MTRFTLLALLPLLFSLAACAQTNANDNDRAERIAANLQFEFPQLQGVSIEMGEIGPSGIPGLERGSFIINGQQTQPFLITEDDTQFYLIVGDPIDVSRDAHALATAESERLAEAEAEAENRAAFLEEAFSTLPVRGNPDADITIIEFSDFQCPYCARAFSTMEDVMANNEGDVRFIYVQYPLPNHNWARPASMASLCAAQQDDEAFWVLHDRYFENQRSMTAANVMERSTDWLSGTGVDVATWQACVEDTSSDAHHEAREELEKGMQIAGQYEVTGTPAFFINGRFLNGAQPLEVFQAVIDDVAAGY